MGSRMDESATFAIQVDKVFKQYVKGIITLKEHRQKQAELAIRYSNEWVASLD